MNTYNTLEIVAVWNGILIQGYMDGTFMTAEHDEDAVMKHTGAGGDVTRTINANKGGAVTFTLTQSSLTNNALSAAGTDKGSLLVKDLHGTTLISAEESWVKKKARVEYAKEVTGREWIIDCAALAMTVAGAADA